MDIAETASALQAARVQQQVGTAVARKTLDAQKQGGEAAVALIQAAAEQQKQSFDVGSLDVTA